MTAPALELAGIQKRFGSVHALRRADFVLLPGELHALLGENGAGKSTLMRIPAGLIQPDDGTISIRGAAVTPRNPRAARRHGIGSQGLQRNTGHAHCQKARTGEPA